MKIKEIIKSRIEKMSIGQRKVGEYLLENYEKISYETLARISKNASVSETTVIRFCYSLGFESFSSMQRRAQEEMYENENNIQKADDENTNFYKEFVKKEIKILENEFKNLEEKEIQNIVDKISSHEKIICVSSRSIYGIAYWFSKTLGYFKDNVEILNPNSNDTLEALLKVDENTLILAISLSRYSKETYRFVDFARKRKAFIITLSDSLRSPISLISDKTLIVKKSKDETGFNNLISVISNLNLILAGISKKYEKIRIKRIQEIENLGLDLDLFFE